MKSKVRQDEKGVFIQCDGWIGRAPKNTKAVIGTKVNATHPAGTVIFVRFVSRGEPELWEIEKEAPQITRILEKLEKERQKKQFEQEIERKRKGIKQHGIAGAKKAIVRRA